MSANVLICAESRNNPVLQLQDVATRRWCEGDCMFTGEARPGEFFPFQRVVYAAGKTINNLSVMFSSLQSLDNTRIPVEAMNCFHTHGKAAEAVTLSIILMLHIKKIRAA